MTTTTTVVTPAPAGFVSRALQGLGILLASLGIALLISICFPIGLQVVFVIILPILVIREVFGPSKWIKSFMGLLTVILVLFLVAQTGGGMFMNWVKREYPLFASAIPRIQFGADVAVTAATEPAAVEAKAKLQLHLRKMDELLSAQVDEALKNNDLSLVKKLITEQEKLRAEMVNEVISPPKPKPAQEDPAKTTVTKADKPWTKILSTEKVELEFEGQKKPSEIVYNPKENIEFVVTGTVKRVLGKDKFETISGKRTIVSDSTGIMLFQYAGKPATVVINKYNS